MGRLSLTIWVTPKFNDKYPYERKAKRNLSQTEVKKTT